MRLSSFYKSTEIIIDNALSSSSTNPVQNKVVKSALDSKITMPSNGSVGQVLKKTSNGVEWSDDLIGNNIVDSSLSTTSENPVQNKVITNILNEKLTIPSGGNVGQVIKKTFNGYEWADDNKGSGEGGAIDVDSSLSDISENPVQNKVIKFELDKKITAPENGSVGQILSKTSDGYAWINTTSGSILDTELSSTSENAVQNKIIYEALREKVKLSYLLFRVPVIEEEEYYQFYIDFSETDDFAIVESYNTKENTEMFKAFTGLGMTSIQNWGVNYLFSDEQLQFDVSTIAKNLKYFRFRWSNDEGETFGRYGYGNFEAEQNIFGSDDSVWEKIHEIESDIGNAETDINSIVGE